MKGNVELDYSDSDYMFFNVKSKKETYMVDYDVEEGVWRCICPDFNNRHKKANGSFACKHVLAAMFKLAEVKGVNAQATLEGCGCQKTSKTA